MKHQGWQTWCSDMGYISTVLPLSALMIYIYYYSAMSDHEVRSINYVFWPQTLFITVTYSWVLFHNETLLLWKFNTQLLITVSNSSRILTHVQPLLVLWYNPQITLRTHGCVLSICVSEHDSTVHRNSSMVTPPFHCCIEASVSLLCGHVFFIVVLPRGCNNDAPSNCCATGGRGYVTKENPICHITVAGKL
jgi:hypothetical protein